MIDCQFCKNPGSSVEAHVIPEAIFLSVKLDSGPLREMGPVGHPKRRLTGIWDDQIWCRECEKTYSSSESDAISCWRQLAGQTSLSLNEPRLGTSAGFHDFVLFMLWKASKSKMQFYNCISLGPMQSKLRDALIDANEQGKASFEVILTTSVDPPRCIIQPIKIRINGVQFSKFYLDHLDVLVKTDSRPLPSLLQPLAMSREADYLIIHPSPRPPHLKQFLHDTALNRQALRTKKMR